MAKCNIPNIVIEGARIVQKNFSGEATKYNRKGDRNFLLILDDPDVAMELKADGWNVKQFKPREDDTEEPAYFILVAVRFDPVPPNIYMVTSRAKRLLTEETVDALDYADIANIDLTITPYRWTMDDKDGVKTGIKAYVKTMYVVINEDEFASKYERD